MPEAVTENPGTSEEIDSTNDDKGAIAILTDRRTCSVAFEQKLLEAVQEPRNSTIPMILRCLRQEQGMLERMKKIDSTNGNEGAIAILRNLGIYGLAFMQSSSSMSIPLRLNPSNDISMPQAPLGSSGTLDEEGLANDIELRL